MTLNARIKSRREDLGMTQAELADLLGYSDRSTIAKIEAGVNDITQSKIEAFAKALHTTPAYLMGWTDDYYDYDLDEDDRFASIPTTQLKALLQNYNYNLPKVWNAWETMQDEILREVNEDFAKSTRNCELPNNIRPIGPMERVPLLGTIACGEPILAEQNIRAHVDLPGHIHADFALECKGDSMQNAGIRDGDIVYIREQERVENGEIAAVLIGEEATLKRFYQTGDKVVLYAENTAYPPFMFVGEEINNLRILGRAVAYTHWME